MCELIVNLVCDEMNICRCTCIKKSIAVQIQTDRQGYRQVDKDTDRQTRIKTGRQGYRQEDKDTHKQSRKHSGTLMIQIGRKDTDK